MLRLFLSLYLIICCGLLFINFTSNQLYFWLQEQPVETHIESVYQPLLKQYQILYDKIDIASFKATLSASKFSLLDSKTVALPDSVQMMLHSKPLLHLVDDTGQQTIYYKLSEQHLLQLPVSQYGQVNWVATALIVISYIVLAGFVLLWSRPLWRDLSRLRQFSQSYTPTNNSNQQISQLNQISRLSVLKPLVSAFEQMTVRINQLVAQQKHFAHAVSHDIRTPLARLKFAAEVMPQTEQSHLKQDFLDDINEIEVMVDELLNFARIDSQQPQMCIELVNITQLLQNIIEKLNRNSSMPITLLHHNSVFAYADGLWIEKAVQNVLTNAQKFAKSQVFVDYTVENDNITIIIEDDGPGIPEESRQLALAPFIRLEKSRNKANSGFGLGLSICNRILSWHHGSLSIDSGTQLKGAKVALSWPVQDANEN